MSSAHDGRYAPSPTGSLHVGNLRTALLAWLFARSEGARFLLRIEDLDAGRVREAFVGRQLADLRALGLDWDGQPVRQTRAAGPLRRRLSRGSTHGAALPVLLHPRRRSARPPRAPHGALPEGAYPGTCRRLGRRERAAREAAGRPPALRVDAGAAEVGFTDRLAGPVSGVVDDFVVRRSDGVHAYNLAVVVDDAEQGVGEVVRGADLLDSTPRQLWLAGALGVRGPSSYAHVPLVLGPDGARLAKRHGAVTLAERVAPAQSPDAVRAELAASVGLCAPGELPERRRSSWPASIPR